MSLEKVNIELKEANIKLEDLKLETLNTNEFLNLATDTFSEKLTELINFFKGSSLKELEQKREERAYQEKLLAALESRKLKVPTEKKKEAESSLGGVGALIAGLIGTTIGVIKGWISAMKSFYKLLTPQSIMNLASDAFKGIKTIFEGVKTSIANQVKTISTALSTGLAKFISLFDSFKDMKVTGVFSAIGEKLKAFIKIFTDAGAIIKNMLSGPVGMIGEMFASIGNYIKSFGAMIGKVAGIVSKIFAPLLIIMTIWDTVKGAIEGFEKEGIIGGIKGAITGFFNSLIFGPLDMIKDAIAWVLGMFGFDKAKEILKTFSFADTFTKIVEALFFPFQWLQDNVMEMVDMAKNFFSDKLKSIKAFFGIGGEEKEQELKTAEARRKRVEGAQAVAIDPKTGLPVTMSSTTNGISDPERAKAELVKAGLKPMSDEERKVYEEELKKEESIKRKDLEDFKGAPKIGDVIPDILDSMFGIITQAKDWIIAKFESAAKFVADVMPNIDVVKEFLKSVLRNVLPIADSGKKWYDVGNLVSKAIPNSVYKFAGIDPKTGALTEEPKVDAAGAQQIIAPSVSRNEQMTREMAQSQEEQQILRDQAAAGAGGSILSQSSTVNNMTNNNTTVVKPSPSATRVPQAASDMFYTQMGYGYAAP